ncbi:sulfurtransferase [Chryseobacterium sp. SNU WT5]|uniref:sulfurtransferase n=1 Tax=Chryseobacterium sp. SNU WT5 TaxID=2594269 RepID=UPI0011802263|nr:sulfurtransferase [Chryseobacterium sp. SNU WT5]QDP85510.1 sulfurtransferase [Chryseobacterium sp. SNU WT5]
MNLPSIINPEELQVLDQENIVTVNAGSGDAAYKKYILEHLDNALYVDLNKDLAEIPNDAKNGGRHPLPTLDKFSEVLQSLGISEQSHVIVYDDQNGTNAAARFWWMLRSAGIENTQVLNGGLQNAKNKGSKINSNKVEPKKVEKISLKHWKLPLVDIDFVEKVSENTDYLVIDVRDKDRYAGKSEPIDEIAGHIPGAVNIPFKDNLNADGTFKQPKILQKKYVEFLKDIPSHKIIIHCGSGVTACHTLLALDYAGFKIPNLYIGSWSEWSRNDKPIATNL